MKGPYMSPERRTYVLDTSVLLSSPRALYAFEEHDVVLPLVVVTELEDKRSHPTLGYHARVVLRALEALRNQPGADLRKGVAITPEGGMLRIEINHVDQSHLPETVKVNNSNDTRILSVCDGLRRAGADVILVSKDLPLRLLCDVALGIPAQEYRKDQVADTGYTGLVEVEASKENIDELYHNGHIALLDHDIPVNTGVVLTGQGSSALARVTADKQLKLVRGDLEAFGAHGRSAEQRIALANLLDPTITCVSLGGNAGTGKSVLALAAALEIVMERRDAKRIMVFRPIFAVGGQELGFLPGSEAEKMAPYSAAVKDALNAITTEEVIAEVIDRGMLEVLPLTYIRGRTLTDTIVILDEAQNLERATILTAISRLGKGSRVFLTHDVAQRDNLHVGRYDGIAAVVERLKGQDLFAHTTLTRSERSPMAELATRLLDDFVPEN